MTREKMKKATDDYELSATQLTAAMKRFTTAAIHYNVAIMAARQDDEGDEEEEIHAPPPPSCKAVVQTPVKKSTTTTTAADAAVVVVAVGSGGGTKRPRDKPLPPDPFVCPGNLETGAPCATPTEPPHKTQVKHEKKLHFVCIKDRADIVKRRKAAAPKKPKVATTAEEDEDEEREIPAY